MEPLRQGVAALFEGYEAGIAQGLTARHGHGSQYVSDYFHEELRFLGIESSPAFVRDPEGKGVAERFIRTLKEQQFLFEARPRLGRVDPDALGGAVVHDHEDGGGPLLARHAARPVHPPHHVRSVGDEGAIVGRSQLYA